MPGNKGQMYILFAAILITFLVSLRFYTYREKNISFFRLELEKKIFDKIFNELEKTLDFSYPNFRNASLNFLNFSYFLYSKLPQHSLNFDVVFMGVEVNQTVSSFNITFFQSKNDHTLVKIKLNETREERKSIKDKWEVWNVGFSYPSPGNYTFILKVDSYQKTILVSTSYNFTAFFEVELTNGEFSLRNQKIKTYEV